MKQISVGESVRRTVGRTVRARSSSKLRIARELSVLMLAGLLLCRPAPVGAIAGGLDATFGAAGKVTTDFSGNVDEARSLAIQADGKIVVAGETFGS